MPSQHHESRRKNKQGIDTEKKERCVREHKSVAVDPFRVLGVEGHELVEQDMGHWGHAHRGARVARVCLERGIDLASDVPVSN